VEKEQLGAAETSFSDPPFQNSSSSLEKLLGWVHNSRAGMSSLPPRSPQQEDPPALWLPTEPTKSVSRDWDPMCLEVGILRGGGQDRSLQQLSLGRGVGLQVQASVTCKAWLISPHLSSTPRRDSCVSRLQPHHARMIRV
jgi:hypothetical protein